jgi:hypothetical protein
VTYWRDTVTVPRWLWQLLFLSIVAMTAVNVYSIYAQSPTYSFGLTATRANALPVHAEVRTATKEGCDWLRSRMWLLRLTQLVPGRPDTYGDDPQIAVVQTDHECRVVSP